MNAIDTNIFAYAYDPATPVKQTKARQLLSELVQKPDETVLLWQVAVEFLACLRKAERKRLIDGPAVESGFQEVLQLFAVKLPSVALFSRSFALLQRHSLSHWDGLLIAACQEAGVTRLFSEDMQHGANYGGVEIVNPFA